MVFTLEQEVIMNNKVAVITGGNRGLGKDTVLSLAKKQIDSVFTYRSHKQEADEVVKHAAKLGAKALAIQLDLSDILGFTEFSTQLQHVLHSHWQQPQFN